MDQAIATRLARVAGGEPLHEFDPANEAHVDEAARLLLDRFRHDNDGEAFQLLFELTQDRLCQAARQIARQLAAPVEAEDLVAAFMTRLFIDVPGRGGEPVRHFLALAYTSMRNEVLDLLRQQKRAAANQREYASTLREPQDPASELADREHDLLLAAFGDQLTRITSDCFQQLEARDQQVLVAREILHLPYDRVASLLQLAPEQVGMIIRRARMHLADLITGRLSVVETTTPSVAETNVLRQAVLGCLEDDERVKNVKALIQRMLLKVQSEARRRLADLVYEMGKACLVTLPSLQGRTLVRVEPRPSREVAGELLQLRSRLAGMHVSEKLPDVLTVAERRPAASTALDDALRCLSVLVELEGPSGRQQVALALYHIHSGEPAAGERVLRELPVEGLSEITRQNVSRNLTLALLRQERFAEALVEAEGAASNWPDDPVRIMNVCFAAARLRDRERFERHARALCRHDQHSPSPRVRAWIEEPLRHLASDVGLSADEIDALLADSVANTEGVQA